VRLKILVTDVSSESVCYCLISTLHMETNGWKFGKSSATNWLCVLKTDVLSSVPMGRFEFDL